MSFLGGCWKKAVGVFARMRVWPPDGRDAHRPSGEQPTGGPDMVRREARRKREIADFAGTGPAVAVFRYSRGR